MGDGNIQIANFCSWHSYPKIYNLGHRAVKDILDTEVNIEEKIDGSQFSFGLDFEGELHVRSKGAIMYLDAPEKMFTKAVETVKNLKGMLHPGWTYRGEYLAKPKHNVLCYNRVPDDNIIIFDINDGEESYLQYEDKYTEAKRLGLECVPCLYHGLVKEASEIRTLLETQSVLGGQKIEGVVIKPTLYNVFGLDKKVLMAKFVSEAFKEIHHGEWKNENPTTNDIIEQISQDLRTPARWNKAIQHLREQGKIEDSPRDIGVIIKEIQHDVIDECADEIKERLYNYASKHILRKVTSGFPEWYKEELLKKQFE